MEFNCTIEQLLEFKILFPTEESPNIQKVLSNFSRQQLLNMIVVLGNRYANKSFLEITDFFSDRTIITKSTLGFKHSILKIKENTY